jgi:hypothetical protein
MGAMVNDYSVLVGKPEAKKPLRSPAHRWEGDIKIDFRKIGLESVDCICPAAVGSGGVFL